MKAPVRVRIARVVLALSVSVWMAGTGCIWSCSNTAMASGAHHSNEQDAQALVAGSSCHSQSQSQSHDCCSKKSAEETPDVLSQASVLSVLSALPQGMMKDCPLVVNASAVITSKVSGSAPDSSQAPAVELPNLENRSQPEDSRSLPIQYLNRGPTYLRCCVFLI
jgi:hypothetical protein